MPKQKKKNPRATERQKRGVRLASKIAPFASYPKIGKRLGLSKKQVFDIARKSGLSKGKRGKKRLPHSVYFRLVFKLDNYSNRPWSKTFFEEGLDHVLKYQFKDFEGFCGEIRGMNAYQDYTARIKRKMSKLDVRDYEHKDALINSAVHSVEEEIFERSDRHLTRLIENRIQPESFAKLPVKEKKRILRRAQSFARRAGARLPQIVKDEIKKLKNELF